MSTRSPASSCTTWTSWSHGRWGQSGAVWTPRSRCSHHTSYHQRSQRGRLRCSCCGCGGGRAGGGRGQGGGDWSGVSNVQLREILSADVLTALVEAEFDEFE